MLSCLRYWYLFIYMSSIILQKSVLKFSQNPRHSYKPNQLLCHVVRNVGAIYDKP